MDNGINLKQFNKWIKENVGKRCESFAVGCLICQSWEVYDALKRYLDGIDILEDPNQGLHKSN